MANSNLDAVAIGGTMATVGIGVQVPVLRKAAAYTVKSVTQSAFGGGAKLGEFIAEAVIGTVGAPAVIIGGLAIVAYEMFKD